MKRLTSSILTLSIVVVMLLTAVGCIVMTPSEGVTALKKAYENTRDNYSDIYQYSEKVYDKAVKGQEGSIDNFVVNVNCAVDRHYNLIKDKDYAIYINHDRYIETVDDTMKLTKKFAGSNEIIVGETHVDEDKAKENALFVSTNTIVKDGKGEQSKINRYYEQGIKAQDFDDSIFFERIALMNTQVMQELDFISEKDMDFGVPKGGIQKKGRTTDYKFGVSADYLARYEETYGRPSLFDGIYVWVQTSYDRISNVYVYREETLGGGLKAEYESYVFMITYLGKRVPVPTIPTAKEQQKDGFDGYRWHVIMENGDIKKGILSPLEIVG